MFDQMVHKVARERDMKGLTIARSALVAALVLIYPLPSEAMPIMPGASQAGQVDDNIVLARRGGGGRGFHGGGARVHRGGAVAYRGGGARHVHVNRNIHRNVTRNVHRNVAVRRGVYRGPNVYYRGGAWARPRSYWWPVGGAIAAGAAIGVIGAAAAASWAGSPPGPNYCWYYTDASQRRGFWDVCQ
jgi:hypothetical protein